MNVIVLGFGPRNYNQKWLSCQTNTESHRRNAFVHNARNSSKDSLAVVRQNNYNKRIPRRVDKKDDDVLMDRGVPDS